MSEDDIYRTSTQYRLWSFTRESLASLRSTTNASAADGVRAAIQSQRASQAASDTAHDEDSYKRPDSTKEVDCLTVEEEQKLVGFYCVKAMQFADFCEFPTNVKVVQIPSTGSVFYQKLTKLSGYSGTISQALLPLQLPNDLPPQRDDGGRAFPIYQDREPLHFSEELRF